MEKLLLEACLEMMAIPGLVVGIQDMGAAGLTCSTCETASRGNSGIEIDLDLVPQRDGDEFVRDHALRESGAHVDSGNRGRERELEEVFEKWDLHAARIGEVKEGDRMVVRHKGVVVADLPAKSLTDEAPVYDQRLRSLCILREARDWSVESVPDLKSDGVGEALGKLLVHPTIASKRWVWQQYDHMVMSGCTVEPGSDAGVVRLSIAGIDKYLAIANDCNNRFCFLDPYKERPNRLCGVYAQLGLPGSSGFGGNRQPELRQPEQARGLSYAQGMREGFGRRLFVLRTLRWWEETSVSTMSMGRAPTDPTPVVSMVGLIDDAKQVTRSFVTQAGQSILLIGGLPHELGGSYYLQTQFGKKEGRVPEIDLSAEKKFRTFFLLTFRTNRSSPLTMFRRVGFGCLGGDAFGESGLGFSLSFDSHGPSGRLDSLLFGESQGRVLLAVSAERQESVLPPPKNRNGCPGSGSG